MLGGSPHQFQWCTGIEDTFVPQKRAGFRSLDEYELMQHYQLWREDIDLARGLGVRMMRYGIPWYRVQPKPETFDWTWTDQVLDYMINVAGITPIIDLIHYGTPYWMSNSFLNSSYARWVSLYARAFAKRYRKLVRYYTPINEPTINALLSGMTAQWPPYLEGEDGYVKLIGNMALGVQNTVGLIREVRPDAIMVHVDAAGLLVSEDPRLETIVNHRLARQYIVYDLITGRVDAWHKLHGWLRSNGLSKELLDQLQRNAVKLDILGLNYYPQWSGGKLQVHSSGRVHHRAQERGAQGLIEIVRNYWDRYKVPVMITETSTKGSVALRSAWMVDSAVAVRQLRAEGIPVIGYTWWPMFTMIDWAYRLSNRPISNYLLHLGLWDVQLNQGVMERIETPLVEQFRQIVANSAEIVGPLASPAADEGARQAAG